jgi:ATP-dependent Clp protease protease subunit
MTKTAIVKGLALTLGLTLALSAAYTTLKKSSPKEETTQIQTITPIVTAEGKSDMVVRNINVTKIEADPSQIILLDLPVSDSTVDDVIRKLETARKDGEETVYLLLDSPGGSVVAGAKLIAYIESSNLKINTVCVGVCASMAAQIHQVGKKRLMHDKSILMFHPASGGAQGTIEQMISLTKTLQLYVDRLDAKIAKRVGIDYKAFKTRVANELWIEAQDALAEKFTDGLVLIQYERPEKVKLPFLPEEKLNVSPKTRADNFFLIVPESERNHKYLQR